MNFIPCHHVNAVGPMGGIHSASMPMLVVENVTDGNRAYCNLNEGIGKVMRFGAYGEDAPDSPSLDARCVNASIKRGAGARRTRYRSYRDDGAGHYDGR